MNSRKVNYVFKWKACKKEGNKVFLYDMIIIFDFQIIVFFYCPPGLFSDALPLIAVGLKEQRKNSVLLWTHL